jgi:acyl-CoA reductase-like NAD-dependent aldehyde dehydrogenase
MAVGEEKTQEQSPVDGQAATIAVDNPATGEVIGTIPVLGAGEVADLAARARAAQPAWAALGVPQRAAVMHRAQRWMLDHSREVIECVVRETGKTWEDAQLTDYGYTVTALSFWARRAKRYLADERVSSLVGPLNVGRKLVVSHVPLGLVGVIGPWNYPIVNCFGDCIPALMAGNAVILKPSEVTPFSSQLMAEMLSECGLPDDLFAVATGDGSTGAALVDAVDCVMFTGSTRTGRQVLRAAAETLTPCYLELGGKDPMVVCADADVEKAANAATYYSMSNAGQICISVERCYVIFPPQVEIVDEHVRDAVAKGARVLTGGHAHTEHGRFFEPTVLVDVDHTMKCMTEETFGPTLPIMKVASPEDGVRWANDSVYGLQASIWTGDVARGEQLARQLQAGAVSVNDAVTIYGALNVPMGGWKESGLGSRHGASGILKYTKPQSLSIARFGLRKELWMFPYRRSTTNLLGRFLKLVYGRGGRG